MFPCYKCDGTGRLYGAICGLCQGTGRSPHEGPPPATPSAAPDPVLTEIEQAAQRMAAGPWAAWLRDQYESDRDAVRRQFLAMGWPEGFSYCTSPVYAEGTAHAGMLRNAALRAPGRAVS